MTAAETRTALTGARRVVVKVGTAVLTDAQAGLCRPRLNAIVQALAAAHQGDREVLLVSSGAVGLGRAMLGLDAGPRDLATRQACAAVGQGRLMALYADGLLSHGVQTGQVLLTQADFDDRLRYLNLRSTLTALMRRSVLPVINENDAVSTEELAFEEGAARPVFGDNDMLSALVAAKLSADLLLLLTDVDGVYDRDPRQDPLASPIRTWDGQRPAEVAAHAGASSLGRGGMRSKIDAACVAASAGCQVVVASGLDPENISRVLAGEVVGTWFPASGEMAARDRWIAFAAPVRGTLHLDAGAVDALRHRGASLLAAGVTGIEGSFQAGDVVALMAPDGGELGRGIICCDQAAARAWAEGLRPDGVRNHDALVHRDHMVVRP
jgi:glutamate 5-kinase